MKQVNEIRIVGIVGSVLRPNPEVTRFSVVTTRAYESAGGSVCETTWHDVVCSGTKDFSKGDPVKVTGRIQSGSYTDMLGNERTFTWIIATEVEKLDETPTIDFK